MGYVCSTPGCEGKLIYESARVYCAKCLRVATWQREKPIMSLIKVPDFVDPPIEKLRSKRLSRR